MTSALATARGAGMMAKKSRLKGTYPSSEIWTSAFSKRGCGPDFRELSGYWECEQYLTQE
jgi:hypothetical protein